MKLKHSLASLFAAIFLTTPGLGRADEVKTTDKPKPYPLTTCVRSGEKMGSMGNPYVLVHEGREIKLCCKGCLADFKKDAAKYVKQLEEAEKKQKK